MTRETPDLRAATVTAYLCADDRDGLVCALYSGHPTDRGPGHVWVAVEELIAAGTVAWRAASTSGTTPSENVLHVLTATPEPASPCRCGHPFDRHRTPGTECSVIGCDCEPYEPAPAVLDRYRAIIEDTARWLETETPEAFDGQRIALTLRHWLDDPADFDKYAGMAGALRALTALPSEATDG